MKNNYLVRKTYTSFMMVSVLSVLAATLGILIDNVIAGKLLGQEALSAMSIVGSMSYVFSCLSNLCVLGGTIKAAQALGRGEKEAPSQFFSAAVIFFAVISLLISALGLMFPETNGKPFDPIAYSDTHEVGIGLKIIRGMAQEIAYSHNLILNELYVKL